jgi:hypothetical protein
MIGPGMPFIQSIKSLHIMYEKIRATASSIAFFPSHLAVQRIPHFQASYPALALVCYINNHVAQPHHNTQKVCYLVLVSTLIRNGRYLSPSLKFCSHGFLHPNNSLDFTRNPITWQRRYNWPLYTCNIPFSYLVKRFCYRSNLVFVIIIHQRLLLPLPFLDFSQ